MVIVEFLDSAEAMHAAEVLRAFGLTATVTGRELDAAEEPPFMVWTVATPDLRDTPTPEIHDEDFIASHFDAEAEDREYWRAGRNRIYRRDLYGD